VLDPGDDLGGAGDEPATLARDLEKVPITKSTRSLTPKWMAVPAVLAKTPGRGVVTITFKSWRAASSTRAAGEDVALHREDAVHHDQLAGESPSSRRSFSSGQSRC